MLNTQTQPTIYQTYEKLIAPITQWYADKLDDAVEDYGKQNVEYALEQAAKYKKTSWNYIMAILRNMQERGQLIRDITGDDYANWND